MTTINKLNAVDTLQGSDLMAIFSNSSGDSRKAAMSTLLNYMTDNLDFSSYKLEYNSQYSAPAATGFNIQVTDDDSSTFLIITPVAGYAAGTIILPTSSNLVDKQELKVVCTQAITTLTITGNGATVSGAPTTIVADDYFTLRYDLPGNTWYRVG